MSPSTFFLLNLGLAFYNAARILPANARPLSLLSCHLSNRWSRLAHSPWTLDRRNGLCRARSSRRIVHRVPPLYAGRQDPLMDRQAVAACERAHLNALIPILE